MNRPVHKFKTGALVQVLSEAEIVATLDADGNYEGMPFTAEMRRFCGKFFRVYKRTDRICVERPFFLEHRRLKNAVMLDELRCNGADHDDCQRMCMLFWKEAWLRPAPLGAQAEPPIDWIAEQRERQANMAPDAPIDENKTYSCQSTALFAATQPVKVWEPQQYLRDLKSGAWSPLEVVQVLYFIARDKVVTKLGGREYNSVLGQGKKTPFVSLQLKAGDLVQIRRKDEIVSTLDAKGKNRGLGFAGEMFRHSGATKTVLSRIDRMILEYSGKMKRISNTVLVEGTSCSGICIRGCARNGHPMWREAWLEQKG
jgi:hypothetical protein